jgi:hypothetical protein
MFGASYEVRWPLETGVVLHGMPAYAEALSTCAGARSNVSAGFFSLEFVANLAPFFGLCFSGAFVCGAEL